MVDEQIALAQQVEEALDPKLSHYILGLRGEPTMRVRACLMKWEPRKFFPVGWMGPPDYCEDCRVVLREQAGVFEG